METLEGMIVAITHSCSTTRSSRRIYVALAAVITLFVLAPAGRAQEIVVQLEPAQSKIEFTLGSTLHTVEGAFKLKSGSIRYDPSSGKMSGSIIVDATSGASGNDGRDRKMHREILESAKYPEFVFTPSRSEGTFNPKGPSKLQVSGQFSIHGKDHEMILPIEIAPAGKQFSIATHMTIPYIKWGMKNPSTFILRASDKVEIEIHTVGQFVGEGTAR